MPKTVMAAVCLFILLGILLIPYAGVEIDEALCGTTIFRPIPTNLWITVFGHHIPLMKMSYLGTLKTLIYWPIFGVFGVSAFSLRLPMVLAGAATILIFYNFTARAASPRAAIFASLLLATDPIFLVADTFDWGPVALEHLLLVTGCWLILRRHFALAGFVLGLALWNKAIFIWALAGLVAGAIIVYLPEVRRLLADGRTLKRAVFGFLLGAAPLIVYNLNDPNATLAGNARFSFEGFTAKAHQLEGVANGSSLLGYITSSELAENPKPPQSYAGGIAVWIRSHSEAHRTSLFPYAIVLALLAAPLWWRTPLRRTALFAIVFTIVTFLAMAVTKGGGGGAHHAVLVWPMPHLLVGVALAALPSRWFAGTFGLVLIASNLLMINRYVADFEQYGADGAFSDAVYPLVDALGEFKNEPVYVSDWGILDNVDLLTQGSLSFRVASGPFMNPTPDESQRREITALFADPRGIFLGHVPNHEMFKGVGERLNAAADAAGYDRATVRTIADSNGRPFFELFRFVKRVQR